MSDARKHLETAMRAVASRITGACDKSWSAESIALLVETLIKLHERLCLETEEVTE